MGPKKSEKLAKKAAAVAAKKDKQAVKAAKKKAKELGLSGEEEDIQALLRQYDVKPQVISAIGKTVQCDQPLPRAACSLTLIPGSTSDFLLFGGEFYEGAKVQVYNETYRCNFEKQEFRRVECPVSPKPRCSHQAVAYKDSIYIFGGEFATYEQFYHFRDLWRFDPKSNTWTEVPTTGTGPSARSGHRMVVFKNLLVLFGGFYDALREVRYFNDLYVLNFQSLKWTKIVVPAHSPCPSPRSGVLMAAYPQGDGVVVCGGYCKLKDTAKNAQGRMLEDAWWLNMKNVATAVSSGGRAVEGSGTLCWEKLGKKAAVPSLRSGITGVAHKSLLVCFGGVHDDDDGGISMRSVFYNDLHCFDMERRRWHVLRLKNSSKAIQEKKRKKRLESPNVFTSVIEDTSKEGTDSEMGFDSDDDDADNYFGYIDVDGKMVKIKIEADGPSDIDSSPELRRDEITPSTAANDEAPTLIDLSINGSAAAQSADAKRAEIHRKPEIHQKKNVDAPVCGEGKSRLCIPSAEAFFEVDKSCPLPRLNACVAMKGNEVIIYGGLLEVGSREFTLDDCWSMNINTRQKWNCLLPGHVDEHPWNEPEASESDSSDDGYSSDNDSSDDSNSDDSSSDEELNEETDKVERKSQRKSKKFIRLKEEIGALRDQLLEQKRHEIPNVGETLKEFFERTKTLWQDEVAQQNGYNLTDVKELRKEAFEECAKYYHSLRPVLQRLEQLEKINEQP